MSKIGIITMYYGNKNYGGLLQSYALAETINQMGFHCEQICRPHIPGQNLNNTSSLVKEIKVKKIARRLKKHLFARIIAVVNLFVSGKLQIRENLIKEFEKSIPHSETVFTRENISKASNEYECFITGSDQVWNMSWYNQEYFLDFAPETKYKFSYAASMPDIDLSDIEKECVRKHLLSFKSVSTREQNTADFLSDLTGHKVKHVLDPTLLLGTKDWDKVVIEYEVEGKYIFCYFLGDDSEYRKIVKRFAKKLGLKIATLPHLNQIKLSDIGFADHNIYDAGPREFISLIKNAEYVFTDSFHAIVFSNIYSVKHYVFSRTNEKMDSRIVDVLDMFGNEKRFCNTQARFNDTYIYNLKDLNTNSKHEYEQKRKESLNFLKVNLTKSKEKNNDENQSV